MRQVAVLLLLTALAACGDRRSFDQRYEDASQEIENRARQIDQNVAAEQNTTDRPAN